MIKRDKIEISTGFILMAAVLYFFDGTGMLPAFIPAVILHEAGHAAALVSMGASITGVRISISGLCMSYKGKLSYTQEFAAALAGPAAGFAGAVAMAAAGMVLSSRFMLCSAGLGFLLTVFNLLPALPLDGGRMLHLLILPSYGTAAADRALFVTGAAVSALLIFAGAVMWEKGAGAALIPAGIWIFALGGAQPLVKTG